MTQQTLEQACTPRASVFDPAVRDTVYSIDDLRQVEARQFFAENYVTAGMKQLLSESFQRLEGKSQHASGAFLLSQSMGGGKTHNLLALGLLAKHPELRREVMDGFYEPGPLGAVRVVTFSGRKTNLQYGLWGEIAEQLNKRDVFNSFYSPLRPPGEPDWVTLLDGQPVLILLDELPPYFTAAQATEVGATTLDVITTTALANLLAAVASGKLPQTCVVLTDLRSSAYSAGSAALASLTDLEQEANRTVMRIDPVQLASDELYHIMRTRLFERLPEQDAIDAVADAYAQALDDARRMDQTTASPQQLRAEIRTSYPFHPGIRDLYARFRENAGFQQTRALIRIMRIIVADLWNSGAARERYLIGAHELDLRKTDVMSELRQINRALDNAIAHDIATTNGNAVAEQIDAGHGRDATDAATLIYLSSLSQAVNPVLGLDRSTIVRYLAAPERDLGQLRVALDKLQQQAWYLHATSGGLLFFRNVENLNAKLESYAHGMLGDARETELRERLTTMFAPKLNNCYQDLAALPALDQIQPTQERVTLVVFRPTPNALAEVTQFWEQQQFKNRLLFLTGTPAAYGQVLERAAYLRAIDTIIREFRAENMREDQPQYQDAEARRSKEASGFYLACREAFQTLYYPSELGLTRRELEPQYVGNNFEGEQQITKRLTEVYKFSPDANPDSIAFRNQVEFTLWPRNAKEVDWAVIKRNAATNPAWIWHHPRALDDLRAEMLQRDQWRDASGGYLTRGPFPKPRTDVSIQQMSRDRDTGQAQLRVKPLFGDTVLWSEDGPATPDSPRLDSADFATSAIALSFLAIDSTGEHATGEPREWRNEVELKYKFFQRDDRWVCELHAVPDGEISYTVDGSSPDQAGVPYTGPFEAPPGARVVLARARADGSQSQQLRADVPVGKGPEVAVDPRKPAIWKRRHDLSSTQDTHSFLDLAAKLGAELAGAALIVSKDGRWAEFRVDGGFHIGVEALRAQASTLVGLMQGGSLQLEAAALRFAQGQDLTDMVAELKETLKPGEVEQ